MNRPTRFGASIALSLLILALVLPSQVSAIAHASPAVAVQQANAASSSKATAAANSLYWGAYIDGQTYGPSYSNAPWGTDTWDLFESHAGRKVSILHWGEPWYWSQQAGYPGIGDGHFQSFYVSDFDKVRQRGAIPLLDWGSWALYGSAAQESAYSLANIANGNFDTYLRQWATDAKAWGHPFFLRFDWEMNGNWFPWSELTNGNSAGQFVTAWRHLHDIFASVGATNVNWVWCPSIEGTDASEYMPLAELYPGNAYVDWTCLDAYNKESTSLSIRQLLMGTDAGTSWLADSYQQVLSLAAGKPMMLGETASNEYPLTGTVDPSVKANWITDMLTNQLPNNFPGIRAVVWFNWNSDPGTSFVIESSSASQAAFASGINSGYYTANNYANLNTSPIPPPVAPATPAPSPTLSPTPGPTATPTATPTAVPTTRPTATPTRRPTVMPTAAPTRRPAVTPTAMPARATRPGGPQNSIGVPGQDRALRNSANDSLPFFLPLVTE